MQMHLLIFLYLLLLPVPLNCLTHLHAVQSSHKFESRLSPHNRELLSTYQQLGERLEIVVDKDGIYRLGYQELQAAGLDLSRLNPKNLSLYCQGEEIAIHIEGEGDEHFDPGDYIIFYGQQFRGDRLARLYGEAMTGDTIVNNWLWLCTGDCSLAGMFEKYTENNTYFLKPGGQPGLRIPAVKVSTEPKSAVTYSYEQVRFEQSRHWWSHEFTSEESWFWDDVQGTLWTLGEEPGIKTPISRKYSITINHIEKDAGNATVKVAIASRNGGSGGPDYHLQIGLNSAESIIEAEWDGRDRKLLIAEVPTNLLREGENEVRLTLLPMSADGGLVKLRTPRLYLDWIDVSYPRRLVAEAGVVSFSSPPGVWSYEVEYSEKDRPVILEVGQPSEPKMMESPSFLSSDPLLRFRGFGATRYVLSSWNSLLQPLRMSLYAPPNYAELAPADYVIVGHRSLWEGILELADYRKSTGLSVALVDVEDLYREFNFGIIHPIAIKNFLAFCYANWTDPPQFLVLAGGGHFNLLSYDGHAAPPILVPPNLAYVDPWQGETDSANLLVTLQGEDTLPDVHVGRIPANTPGEFRNIVRKIKLYEQRVRHPKQAEALFIADNPDFGGNFPHAADRVIEQFFTPCDDFLVRKLYSSDHGCTKTGQSECETIKNSILEAFSSGTTELVNFIGHASVDRWTHEHIFTSDDVRRLGTDVASYPVLVSMSCLDGFWHHPDRASLVSRLLSSEGGIVAAFTPTGLGLVGGHARLHEGFYAGLSGKEAQTLGQAALSAKLSLLRAQSNLDLLHTYTILGDPALRLEPICGSISNGKEER